MPETGHRRQLSRRMQDYLGPSSAPRGAETVAVSVHPCPDAEVLQDLRGRLLKLEHTRGFLAQILDQRDKQLFPRDLLVAWAPSRRSKSGVRPVGFIRRSLKFEKEHNCSSLYIEFVWVLPECRGLQLGRTLLHAALLIGKPKYVRLVVAGSVGNLVAIRLYESVGFVWTDSTFSEMVLSAQQAQAAVEAYVPPLCRLDGPPSSAVSAASAASAASASLTHSASSATIACIAELAHGFAELDVAAEPSDSRASGASVL